MSVQIIKSTFEEKYLLNYKKNYNFVINYKNVCKFMLIRKVWVFNTDLFEFYGVKNMGVYTKIIFLS